MEPYLCYRVSPDYDCRTLSGEVWGNLGLRRDFCVEMIGRFILVTLVINYVPLQYFTSSAFFLNRINKIIIVVIQVSVGLFEEACRRCLM